MKLNKFSNQTRTWTLGAEAISEGDNYTHLGVTCNKYSKLGTVIDGACRSLCGNLMALINIGLTPHRLQGGFRKGLGCLMSSLRLQECISYANENRSKLYACFLDSRQAFDRVWHQGLNPINYPIAKEILLRIFDV